MNYSKEAQELAYAWESTKTPLEAIAEDYIESRGLIYTLNNLLKEYEQREENELS